MAMDKNEEAIELTQVTNGAAMPLSPTGTKSLKRFSSIGKTTKIEDKNFFVAFFDQLVTMLKRNTVLQIRYKSSTLTQMVLAPLIFHLILFVLQQADYNNQRKSILHPPAGALPGVSPCKGFNGKNCILFMYYPQNAETTAYMNAFATANAARSGNTFTISPTPLTDPNYVAQGADASVIYPVPSQDFIYDYTLANPNVTRWGITFEPKRQNGVQNIRYQLWYNMSLTANQSDIFGRELLSVVRGIDEAIITQLNGGTVQSNLDYQMKDWPLIPATTLSDTIVQALGPVFFFCSIMVVFINTINQIVSEKEAKLRLGMEMMGLKPSVYWLSQFLSTSLVVLVNSLLTSVFGIMFGFSAFKNTNFGVLWVTFFLFGESMVMFGFLTCFVRQARVGVLLAIFIFIVGLLFESFVFSSAGLGYIWFEASVIPIGVYQILATFIPFFNFGLMFLDITTLTTGRLDALTQTFIPGPGFPWDQLYNNIPDNLLPLADGVPATPPIPVESWNKMIGNVIMYGILLWIFDTVIPNEYGTAYPPWFFLLPSYWGYTSSSKQKEEVWLNNLKARNRIAPDADEDDDVVAEREQTLNSSNGDIAVKIVNLRKVYKKFPIIETRGDKVAVKNTCLSLPEGSLLALLGQNGAGKSTTMSILAGLTPASAGDALVYGMSVRTQIGRIRKLLGVCPQHDILFDDLTAKEHIELYAGLKGVPRKYWTELFEERLKAVKLWTVKNVQAGTYSGGMKRRLSLLISTIGDPRVIYMDEPTTGMDPVNRRHVWSFVEKFKKDRVIILTTHSMEEADVLGDRIAIMAHGRLRAIGNAIHLKSKFGSGYRISVITSNANDLKAKVAEMVPNAHLEDDSAGALIYQFPATSTSSIPAFVKWLESNSGTSGIVKTWGISQTTLEEVFLKLIRDANPHGYQSTLV